MARFSSCVLLAMVAVFPYVVYGRSTAAMDIWPLGPLEEDASHNTTGHAQSEEGADPNAREQLYFAVQSVFEPLGVDRCLDIEGAGVVVSNCQQGDRSQKWYLNNSAIMHYGGQCLDAGQPRKRTPVIVAPCDGSRSQKWYAQSDLIRNKWGGECLDVCERGCSTPNKIVITYDCHGAANQMWKFLLGGYDKPTSMPSVEVPKT